MKSSSDPSISIQGKTPFTLYLIGGALGLALSGVVLPWILPGLLQSLSGADTKAFWFFSRGLAIMGYFMLWLSIVWGLLMTTRLSRIWPGHTIAADLHKFVSLLALALSALHGLILVGDKYMNITFVQVFIPFSVLSYRPAWVGLGQIALYLLALIVISFYFRQAIGQKLWRLIHYLSFLTFFAILIHGLAAGSDTMTPGMFIVYYLSGTMVLFLTFYRVLTARTQKRGETVSNLSISK